MSTIAIDPARVERLMNPKLHLRDGKGTGVNRDFDACIMQAVDWLAGGSGASDMPNCADRGIARYCIRLNDSRLFDDDHRDALKPYAPKIVGTRTDDIAILRRRAFIAADYAVRIFAPLVLRALGQTEWANELAALPAVTDRASSIVARDAARKIRHAADANAANANAAAAANANAAYAAAAYAAAALAACGDELRAAALRCLDDMIAAGNAA